MQWRKVMTADYSKFELVVDDEYKIMPEDEYVYDHKGELLFFPDYSPNDIPVFVYPFDIEISKMPTPRALHWGSSVSYSGVGIDCSGVPTFNHYTADYLGSNYKNVAQFEPLTVRTVRKWFGWFLYQLNNSYLQIGK